MAPQPKAVDINRNRRVKEKHISVESGGGNDGY